LRSKTLKLTEFISGNLNPMGFPAKSRFRGAAAEKDRAEKLRALIAKLEEQLANMG